MKKSTKIVLTALLILTVIVSILGAISAFIMFSEYFGDFYTDFSFLTDGVRSNERADAVLTALYSFTNVLIIGALAVIFIFISIGCTVGIVYIYVADSDIRIKELETIVDEAHMNMSMNTNHKLETTNFDDKNE